MGPHRPVGSCCAAHDTGALFEDWLTRHYPNRRDRDGAHACDV